MPMSMKQVLPSSLLLTTTRSSHKQKPTAYPTCYGKAAGSSPSIYPTQHKPCSKPSLLTPPNNPVILVEMGDNIGGGSPGDSTFILAELIAQGASRFVVILYDPEGVQACIQAGVGEAVSLQVGGKMDNLHGDPVRN